MEPCFPDPPAITGLEYVTGIVHNMKRKRGKRENLTAG
jgi:hypothetical protein